MAAAIQLPELYGRSFFLRFLYDGLGRIVTVPGACLLWALLPVGVFGAVSWWNRTLLPEDMPGGISFLEDTTVLGWYFLLPGCFLLLYYSLRLFHRYLNRLPEVLEPACASQAHEELLAIARQSFSPVGMRTWRILFTVFGLIVLGYNAVTNFYPDWFYNNSLKWDTSRFPVSYALARLGGLFVWGYAIPLWVAEVFTQLSVLVKLNRRMAERCWLRISPYAVDGFGGLGQLKTASAWVSYLVLAAGLFFLAPLLRFVIWGRPLHIGNFIGLGVYVICALISAVGPVYLLHRILARRRREMLGFFAEAFDTINSRVMTLVKQHNLKDLGDEELARALETMDRLHHQWQALPVWPLNVGFFLKLLATIIPPMAAFLFQQFSRQMLP